MKNQRLLTLAEIADLLVAALDEPKTQADEPKAARAEKPATRKGTTVSPRLLTVEDVASELQVPRTTAYQYMRQMQRILVGRHVRVSREAFDAWIAEHTQEPIPPRPSAGATAYVATRSKHKAGTETEPLRYTNPRPRREDASGTMYVAGRSKAPARTDNALPDTIPDVKPQ